MSIPTTMKAIKTQEKGKAAVVDAKVPDLPDDYILIKTEYVALNPTDWKHTYSGWQGHTVGCDLAGTVVKVGSKVTKPFKAGDRVAGFSHGVRKDVPESGAFGDYARLKGDIAIHVPDSWSLADAATLGVGITTVGQGLYESLGLPFPDSPSKDKTPILIYGGSTATGLFALQFAKLSGLHVITTCSPKNFDKVKSFGADEVYDYKDDNIGKDINIATNDKLKYAFDCISQGSSFKICADALTQEEGVARYSALLPISDFPRSKDDVWQNVTIGYSVNGEPYTFLSGDYINAGAKDFEFGKKMWGLAEKLVQQGKIKPFTTNREGGWEDVLKGLDDLKENRVSGEKLVYKVA